MQQLEIHLQRDRRKSFQHNPVFVNNPDDAALSLLIAYKLGLIRRYCPDQSDPSSGEYRLIILPFRQRLQFNDSNS